MIKLLLTTLIIFTALAAYQAVELDGLIAETKDIAAETQAAQAEQAASWDKLYKTYKPPDIVPVPTEPEPEFIPLDIPLSAELQEHTYQLCEQHGVPFYVVLAIMENESRFIWQPPKRDSNGLDSIGYMQINYPHWARLKHDYGVDAATEAGNIESGVIIFAELLEKYELEKALVAYQCGERGAKNRNSTAFSRKILKRSGELETAHT